MSNAAFLDSRQKKIFQCFFYVHKCNGSNYWKCNFLMNPDVRLIVNPSLCLMILEGLTKFPNKAESYTSMLLSEKLLYLSYFAYPQSIESCLGCILLAKNMIRFRRFMTLSQQIDPITPTRMCRWRIFYRVFRKNCALFIILCNPSLAYISASSQRKASVQSLMLAGQFGKFLYKQ